MIDFSFAPRTRILTRDGTALYVDASRSPTLASASPGQSVSFDRCSWLPKIGFPTLESYIMHPLMKFRTNTKQKHWEFFIHGYTNWSHRPWTERAFQSA